MYDLLSLPTSRFRVHSDDATFHVTWRGGARFELSGEVSSQPCMELDVTTPSDDFEVTLAQHSRPHNAVTQLKRFLPRDVMLTHLDTSDGVEVVFHEALVPAARPPRFRLFSTDTEQRIRQLDENKLELLGATGGDCLLTILCDLKRVTISVPAGTSAHTTAARIGASMPHGYRAMVDGNIVSVWKDADFFSMVA